MGHAARDKYHRIGAPSVAVPSVWQPSVLHSATYALAKPQLLMGRRRAVASTYEPVLAVKPQIAIALLNLEAIQCQRGRTSALCPGNPAEEGSRTTAELSVATTVADLVWPSPWDVASITSKQRRKILQDAARDC